MNERAVSKPHERSLGWELSTVNNHATTRAGAAAAVLVILFSWMHVQPAKGQSILPALFVTDHISTSPQFGNFASIKSFTVATDGTLTPVGTYFTNDFPYELAISPSGKYLAVGHASALANEDLIIFSVNPDASLTMFAVVTVQSSPFEIAWLDDETLVVLSTSDGNSGVWTYSFDEDAALPLKILPIDSAPTGSFSSQLALHPTEPIVYVPDSPLFASSSLGTFQIEPDLTLTEIQRLSVAPYALDIGITPDARYLYMVSGAGSDGVQGFEIDAVTHTLSQLPFSPFFTPDGAASHIVISPGGALAVVFHGATETVRSFSISPDDGTLFDTGFSFNIGGTGIFEAIQIFNNFLFVTRNAGSNLEAGILVYNILVDGSFVPVGEGLPIPAGTRPYFMEVWNPQATLFGDINGDGAVDTLDIPPFVAALLGEPIESVHVSRSDINQDGAADGLDVHPFIQVIFSPEPTGACCFDDLPCEVVTQDECVNVLGGVYAGNGISCGVCPPIPAPIIDSAFGGGPPYCNDNFTQYQFLVFGSNFSTMADVRLLHDTLPDVLPTSSLVFDEFTVGADFDFAGVPAGTYRLRVTNPDGQFAESPDTYPIGPCF